MCLYIAAFGRAILPLALVLLPDQRSKYGVQQAKLMGIGSLIGGGGSDLRRRLFQVGILAALAAAQFAANAESPRVVSPPTLTYADLAELALPAPVAAHVRLNRATALKSEAASGVPAGHTRFYIEAAVVSLLRGSSTGMPGEVSYLVDVPNDASGKAAKLRKKDEFILFASPVRGKPGELRLPSADAHIRYTPQTGERIRVMLREAAAAGAPPAISGIGKAFHVPGTLAGEGETQIFLQGADGRPISLNVIRRPGQQPQWAVALGDIVDEAAGPPARDTLLWYRLACTLPASLPRQSFEEADAAAASAIAADYRLIKERLGPCTRSRARR